MLVLDYKEGLEMSRAAWTIREEDVMSWGRRFEAMAQMDFSKLMRNCFLSGDNERNVERGNSPTLVFRRYPSLMPELERQYYGLDILVKALLGIPDSLGFKSAHSNKILNDSWVINLRQNTTEENVMMDAFLRGFGPDLKKQWEGEKQPMGIDVSEELKDLWKVYNDAFNHLAKKEEDSLSQLVGYMKRFIDVYEEKNKIGQKIQTLKAKIQPEQPEEDDEEEGDE